MSSTTTKKPKRGGWWGGKTSSLGKVSPSFFLFSPPSLLVEHDFFKDRVRSAVAVGEDGSMIVDAEIVAMLAPEGNLVSSEVFHMQLGISAFVVAVVKERSSIIIHADEVVVVGTDFYYVIVEVLDGPLGFLVSVLLEPQMSPPTVSREGLPVDAEFHVFVAGVEGPSALSGWGGYADGRCGGLLESPSSSSPALWGRVAALWWIAALWWVAALRRIAALWGIAGLWGWAATLRRIS